MPDDPIVREIAAPAMDTGAPCPTIAADDHDLSLTYCRPDGTRVRIVFTFPLVHYFGPPNDETLQGHPLAAFGLTHYATFEVGNSRWIEELRKMNRVHPRHDDSRFDRYRHFVWTFHDNTFECLAESFEVEDAEQA
jgi:hypothetical protein